MLVFCGFGWSGLVWWLKGSLGVLWRPGQARQGGAPRGAPGGALGRPWVAPGQAPSAQCVSLWAAHVLAETKCPGSQMPLGPKWPWRPNGQVPNGPWSPIARSQMVSGYHMDPKWSYVGPNLFVSPFRAHMVRNCSKKSSKIVTSWPCYRTGLPAVGCGSREMRRGTTGET